MPLWAWALSIVVGLLVLVLLYGLGLVLRRRGIARHGGTFELSLHRGSARPERGWLLGVGRYSSDRLEYFRIFSLSMRPKCSWARDDLGYRGQRAPRAQEAMALYTGHVVVECITPRGPVEFGMSPDSLMGLQSWLEARPPGADWNRRPVL